MRRSLQQINEQYAAVQTDPWGVDWRGTMAVRNGFFGRMVVEALQRLKPCEPGLRVLDVGCGSGVLSQQLWRIISHRCAIRRYLAVDVSSAAVARAESLHPQSHIEYRVIGEDMAELEGEEFDLILGFEFLAYLDHQNRHDLFNHLKQLCHAETLLVLSSNVQFGGTNEVYLANDELTDEMNRCFHCLLAKDLFLSMYVDGFERHLLAWQHRRVIGRVVRWMLERRAPPAVFSRLIQSVAGPSWPRHRNRVFVLQ